MSVWQRVVGGMGSFLVGNMLNYDLCFLICLLYGIMEWNTTLLLIGQAECGRDFREKTIANWSR